jgi:CheY-like chemotaxis protein
MSEQRLRVLIIEDKPDMAADAKREIEDAFGAGDEVQVDVTVVNDFDEGRRLVRQGGCDLVVLDVRRDAPIATLEDDTAGRTVFHEIKRDRFVPVVFWTALPAQVQSEAMPPLVAVLEKGELDQLPDVIRRAIDSRAVSVMATLENQVAETLRHHMWTELAPHWEEYTSSDQEPVLAQVLISRLARTLDANLDATFTSHPSHRYIYPPAPNAGRGPGDLLSEGHGNDMKWWVTLTPACDFAQGKADRVTLAHARPLSEFAEYSAWRDSDNSNGKWTPLGRLLTATRDRYRYLPKFREIPDLVIDLQSVRSIEFEDLSTFRVVASLSSPFAESLLAQNSHYAGRVGVPDLEANATRERLLADRTGS